MKDVIIACDFSSRDDLMIFLEKLQEKNAYLKIGMELFYTCGTSLLKELKQQGYRLFLDLKLHDIPNTVYKAMSVLADCEVDMINVHAAGGKEMMMAAKRALTEKNSKAILLAVTQLTSTNQEMMEKELWIEHSVLETVIHYAKNAYDAGCDGVVCSPLEAAQISAACPEGFISVTPGIRFTQDDKGDQKRVSNPYQASQMGSHYIVMGRSITSANDPKLAYNRARRMFLEGVEDDGR